MATLHVRSVPEDLYLRLQKLAQVKNRSLSAQVITLLYQAIQEEERQKRQSKLLADIRRRRFALPRGTPDSVELLREDRRR
jgi:plasmid stability protein